MMLEKNEKIYLILSGVLKKALLFPGSLTFISHNFGSSGLFAKSDKKKKNFSEMLSVHFLLNQRGG